LVYLAGDALGWLPGTGGLVDRLYVPNHYQYFTPQALAALAREAGFTVAALEQENSYLGRYELSPVVRGGLAVLLAAGRAVGMESRLALFARRAREAGSPSGARAWLLRRDPWMAYELPQ